MAIKVTKEGVITVSLGTLATMVVALGTSYSTARAVIAQEITEQIKKEIKPALDAFEVTINQSARNLQRTIVTLEFKRDNCTPKPNCWTVYDAEDLSNARLDLKAALEALAGIRGEAPP